MRADRRYTFLKKLRFGAITALLAVLIVFPAYGQYGGSSEKIRNDFSIRGTGYSIEYSLNGGAWKKGYSPPVKYEKGETVILPEKSELIYGGYSFSGWFRSPDLSGKPSVQIGPDESGDILLYARWECDHSQGTDMKYDGQTHWFYCRVCGKITEYGNHSFSSLLIKEPDCITNGIHRYSCRCGYEYDAPDVAALGHAWKNGLDYNETYHVRFAADVGLREKRQTTAFCGRKMVLSAGRDAAAADIPGTDITFLLCTILEQWLHRTGGARAIRLKWKAGAYPSGRVRCCWFQQITGWTAVRSGLMLISIPMKPDVKFICREKLTDST